MEIFEYTEKESRALEDFKAKVWPAADIEHYGKNMPAFFKKEFTLIAKKDTIIVGYITIIADSGIAQIEPLMVLTELKGKGIGTKLITAAEEKARSLGVHKIWLETGADWESRFFYEKVGYTVRATLPNHTAHKDFLLFDKML
jgi:GNAT superfamily N-acetyltransferase